MSHLSRLQILYCRAGQELESNSMSEEKKDSRTYDLRKMEDLFECVEIVTMARGALYPVDPGLASRLEKVSDALSVFSMNMDIDSFETEQNTADSGRKAQEDMSPGDKKEIHSDQDPFDLLSDIPASSKSRGNSRSQQRRDSEGEDGIIDIITGKKIK